MTANRRPGYLVTALYEEPARNYELVLFCTCSIDPMSGRIVEVSVRPQADPMFERWCDDIGRLVGFHLQAGVMAQRLAQRLASKANGPGRAIYPDHRPGIVLEGLSSPIGAIVGAAAIAQEDWTVMHEQLCRDGVQVARA